MNKSIFHVERLERPQNHVSRAWRQGRFLWVFFQFWILSKDLEKFNWKLATLPQIQCSLSSTNIFIILPY